jgi:hypothetical protein
MLALDSCFNEIGPPENGSPGTLIEKPVTACPQIARARLMRRP